MTFFVLVLLSQVSPDAPFKDTNLHVERAFVGQEAPVNGWCMPEEDARIYAQRLVNCEAGQPLKVVVESSKVETPNPPDSDAGPTVLGMVVAAAVGAAGGAAAASRKKKLSG